ncbi:MULTISPECIES: VOC family protein [Synechococcales]|uniref:VOC family protein n=1 Tax=Synechococcus sp. CS-1333 TaxID=2848638 RepID=UPI00223B8707|nr:VOC family protein [Synechococcus sp. CS-1333]
MCARKPSCHQIGFSVGVVHQKLLGIGIPAHPNTPKAAATQDNHSSPLDKGNFPIIASRITLSSTKPEELTMLDLGLTHVALPASDIGRSVDFYATYADMQVVHRRIDRETGSEVVWLSDHTRPFVIVLIQATIVQPVLSPLAHLGIGCKSREAVDMLCDKARQAGLLLEEPKDSGYPIGYWAFLRDPDGHTLELSYGQEIGLTVTQES